MRPLWTGAIGFGLVNIPVKLYSATQGSELSLDMLDKKDHSNIKYKRVNAETGKEVAWDSIVKGYKIDDKYVVLDDKDFEAANAKKSKLIEISQFVDEKEIDVIFYEMPYYLEPDKSGEKPYALLREALLKAGKVGIASFVMRSKEHLTVIRPTEDVLQLNRIRFAQEIRDPKDLKLPEKVTIKPAELKMAMTLIDQLTEKFDISEYKDTYTEQLMSVIEAKAKGVKVKAPHLKVVHKTSDDLMAQLKASLGNKRKKAS
jgi:DNA end-binding protein Ku